MRIFPILFVLLLAGCTSVGSKIVGGQTYAPKPKNYEIMVFIDPDAPPENVSAEDDYLIEWGGPFLQIQNIEHEFDVIGIVGSGGAPLASKKRILNNVRPLHDAFTSVYSRQGAKDAKKKEGFIRDRD
jgi:hypothetical protein